MAILKGEVEWASVQQPNTRFVPCWCIDILVSAADAKAFSKESKKVHSKGYSVKKEEDGRYRIKLRRDVMKAKGDGENERPTIRDKRNQPLDCLVGNGSVCNVQYSFYEWNNGYGNGVGADFKGVQVLELVEFEGGDGAEFESLDDDEEFENEEVVKETKPKSKAKAKAKPVDEEFDDFDDD